MDVKLNVTRKLRKFLRKMVGVEFEVGSYKVSDSICLEIPCSLSNGVNLRSGVSVGAFTSISPSSEIGKHLQFFSIGRYCSVAAGVWIVPDEHPVNWLTTSSLSYNGESFRWHDEGARLSLPSSFSGKNFVTIGNDVWIGCGCFIKGGVRIGDGAIVAAHAVVTKDVPPYAIVAGSPARIVRYRFDDATISELLELRWWDYDITKVPDLDWSDVGSAIGAIRRAISNGLRPYSPAVISSKELRAYAGSWGKFLSLLYSFRRGN